MSNRDDGLLARIALRTCSWSERWFPDAFACAIFALAIVVTAALFIGAKPQVIAGSFGDGFWSLIPFTMQMCFIIIGGYVVADSPPIAKLTQRIAHLPASGAGAIVLVAFASLLLSLIHWGLCMIFASLLVRALARREDLQMDFRAAGAAAFVGSGSVWAMGLSSSAAQLQANPASMPPAMLAVTGVIPFTETIFLWQSMLLTVVLIIVSIWVAWKTYPTGTKTQTAQQLGIDVKQRALNTLTRTRPGEWLEYSPLLNLLIVALGAGWLIREFANKGAALALSSLNTYNLIFLLLALLLHWRPRHFMDSVTRSVPSIGGVLIQFPIYGAIAAIMTGAVNTEGTTLTALLSHAFTQMTTSDTYAIVVGIYSAVLGLFLPSGGGKWIVEAPYVMQAANTLHYNLGWAVQIYNAAEALPNLINPFWMLPILGILGLKARDLIGYTVVQFIIHVPVVLFLLWLLGTTLDYHPPVLPGAH